MDDITSYIILERGKFKFSVLMKYEDEKWKICKGTELISYGDGEEEYYDNSTYLKKIYTGDKETITDLYNTFNWQGDIDDLRGLIDLAVKRRIFKI